MRWLFFVCCSLLLCLLIGSLSFWYAPAFAFTQFCIACIVFGFSVVWISFNIKSSYIKESDYSIHLQIEQPSDSKKFSNEHLSQIKKIQWSQSKPVIFTSIGLIVISFLCLSLIKDFTSQSYLLFSSPGNLLKFTSKLEVLQGSLDKDDQMSYEFSKAKDIKLKLADKNLLKIVITTTQKLSGIPAIKVKDGNTILHDFQMSELPSKDPNEKVYGLEFSIKDSSKIYIPAFSSKSLADVHIKKLPVPKVSLTSRVDLTQPWHDDKPLPLQIKVDAKNPLQQIKLLIVSGQNRSEELVARVMKEGLKKYDSSYPLILESYVAGDNAEVIVVAVAIDKATPTPLVGQSKPLRIKTSSAYGRYLSALRSLKNVKEIVDQNISKQLEKLDKKAMEHMNKAVKMSLETPFFDSIDRRELLRNFQPKLQKLLDGTSTDDRADFLAELSEFLYEHELLNDRERDRDFFVAARGLSRMLEKPKARRRGSVENLVGGLKEYLVERKRRWKIRTDRMPKDMLPKNSKEMLGDYLDKKLAKVENLDTQKQRNAAQAELSKTVETYRKWVENLEVSEDKSQEQTAKKRQKALSNAQNALKELQKRQSEVSKILDRAQTKNKKDLSFQWPTAKAIQGSNQKKTTQLENQLRAHSPRAARRIKAAAQSMDRVMKSGANDDFVKAESHSDYANRLLRQAQSAAQQEQRKNGSGRRKRRRVGGDNYHGQRIKGDVKFNVGGYEVDKLYRELILDRAMGNSMNDDEAKFMNQYLRQIVR